MGETPLLFSLLTRRKSSTRVRRKRSDQTTFVKLPPACRRWCASSPLPRVSVNRHDEPGPGNEKSPLAVPRLVDLRGLAVRGAAVRPLGPAVPLVPDLAVEDTFQLTDHLGVRLLRIHGILAVAAGAVFPAGFVLAPRMILGPVHVALAPTRLVQELHRATSSRVRVQNQLRVLEDRPTGITSHFHLLLQLRRILSRAFFSLATFECFVLWCLSSIGLRL